MNLLSKHAFAGWRNRPALINSLSFLLGLCLVFAYAPFSVWPLTFIILCLWFYIIADSPLKQATQAGFSFGLGWFGAGISWVYVSIDKFGGLPVVVSLLLMLLLFSYLALYPALTCYLSAKLSRNNRLQLWLLPSMWLFTEYLRSVVLTGFPWLSIGYSQIDSPLSAFAPIIGETGVTLIILCFVVCINQLIKGNAVKWHLFSIASLLLTTIIVHQLHWLTPTHKILKTALIQGNIAQDMKWAPEHEWPTMKAYLDLTRVNYDADLIIWPESAIPRLEPLAQEFIDLADRAALVNNTSIITGVQSYHFNTKEYFNSLVVLGKQAANDTESHYSMYNQDRYYKHHLLPIGEFVPFQQWLRPIAPLFNLPMSSFSRGNYIQPNLVANGVHILPLICFEIAFPEQLRANFSNSTQLLLTVSNDGWFGDSHGPHQHLEIAQMRALEFGRPLLRDTNNGVTAVVDAQGQIINQLPQFKQAVLRTNVALVTGRTPFSRYGHWPSTILASLLLVAYFIRHRRVQTKADVEI